MSSSSTPCAACKFLRRKCTQECVFAPYFPPENPQRFSSVHRVFGASNVAKLLNELQVSQREDAVKSLAYEAEARLRDPVYGCVGLISVLQQRLRQIQAEVAIAKKELGTYVTPQAVNYLVANPGTVIVPQQQGGGGVGGTNSNNAGAFDLLGNFPPNNMGPGAGQAVMGGHGGGQVVIRDPQEQEFLEAQQLAAAQQQQQQAMLRNYEQQQQEMMRFNSGFHGVGGDGGFGHQMGVAVPGGGGGGVHGGEVPPSLALFDNVGSYQMQQQPQQGGGEYQHHQQHHHVPHQPPVEAQLLLSPQQSQQQSDLDDGRSVGPSC